MTADPLAPLRRYLDAGGSLRELEQATGVPKTTLHRWLHEGLPAGILAWEKVQDALRKKRKP